MESELPKDGQLGLGKSHRYEKAEGAFIASAAGDALGWPQELPNRNVSRREALPKTGFSDWERWDGGRFYRNKQQIKAGEYSDDTQLMLAVARSRTLWASNWWKAFTKTELPLWSLYERGGGVSTKRAARAWLRGVPPWGLNESDQVARYFNAGGNGVAMRVLPHAVYFDGAEDSAHLISEVFLDGITTHGHPRALLGAAAYVYAAWWYLRTRDTISFGEIIDVLLREAEIWGGLPDPPGSEPSWMDAAEATLQGDYRQLWSETLDEMISLLTSVQTGLQDGAVSDDELVLRSIGAYGRTKGAGTITTVAALYLSARYATQPTHGVVRAAFGKGTDSDTIAAMVGGLAGCMAGSNWIPQDWLRVQDIEYIRELAISVAQGPSGQDGQSNERTDIGRRQLESIRSILKVGQQTDFSLDGTRQAKVIAVSQPRSASKSNSVRTWLLGIEGGQTMYVNIYSRTPRASIPTEFRHEVDSVEIGGEQEGPRSRVVGAKLPVQDLAKARTFYEKVLGLEPNVDGLEPNVEDSSGVTYGSLSLVSSDYARNWPSDISQEGDGVQRTLILISVPSLEDVLHRIEMSGGTVSEGIKTNEGLGRVLYCFDVDSNPIEVIEFD